MMQRRKRAVREVARVARQKVVTSITPKYHMDCWLAQDRNGKDTYAISGIELKFVWGKRRFPKIAQVQP